MTKKKNRKKSGRTDPKFEISRSRNPLMQNFSSNGAEKWQFRSTQKIRLFTSLHTTEPQKFSAHFPLFGRFRAERSRTSPPNPDVSVSNDPFSPRNSFSSLIFGRKHIFDPTFGHFPSDVSGHFLVAFQMTIFFSLPYLKSYNINLTIRCYIF